MTFFKSLILPTSTSLTHSLNKTRLTLNKNLCITFFIKMQYFKWYRLITHTHKCNVIYINLPGMKLNVNAYLQLYILMCLYTGFMSCLTSFTSHANLKGTICLLFRLGLGFGTMLNPSRRNIISSSLYLPCLALCMGEGLGNQAHHCVLSMIFQSSICIVHQCACVWVCLWVHACACVLVSAVTVNCTITYCYHVHNCLTAMGTPSAEVQYSTVQ